MIQDYTSFSIPSSDMLSIIIPAYNEADNIPNITKELGNVLQKAKIPYEIIFVNDGSIDDTWKNIQNAHASDPRVNGLSFSKNFGKEAAVRAGLDMSSGACCAVLDCDMQHPPAVLPEMYQQWKNGYHIVNGIKETRGKESKLHKFCANSFNKCFAVFTGVNMSDSSDYKLLDRKVINALLRYQKHDAFFRAQVLQLGFQTIDIPYHVQDRQAGQSKWSTISLIKYAFRNFVSCTELPLYLAFFNGIAFTLVALVLFVCCLFNSVTTTALLLLAVCLLCSGITLLALGFIGIYLARILSEVRNRPLYIISERTDTCDIKM